MWSGANPSFIARAIVMIMAAIGWGVCSMAHCPVIQALVAAPNSSVAPAEAWVKKYLAAASIARG